MSRRASRCPALRVRPPAPGPRSVSVAQHAEKSLQIRMWLWPFASRRAAPTESGERGISVLSVFISYNRAEPAGQAREASAAAAELPSQSVWAYAVGRGGNLRNFFRGNNPLGSTIPPGEPGRADSLLYPQRLVSSPGDVEPSAGAPPRQMGRSSSSRVSTRGESIPSIASYGSGGEGSTSSSAPNPDTGPSIRNISTVRSGSTCAWLRNASTLRPVSSSIISL